MPLLSVIALTFATSWPLTKAEKTDYRETSSYSDVISFIRDLQANGCPVRLSWSGKSTEGRDMPLAVIAYPAVSDVRDAKKTGKPIVYVQANIHAGEVEGKEAAQMLLRRCAQEIVAIESGKRPKDAIVDRLILVVNPIYNADGNEKWGPVARNRPEQIGPEMVGLRPNGQGFDLNRDCIKAESPEMRGALNHVYNGWDPDVIMDLHTTDGTRHGYDLTYSPAMNPNTDPAIQKFGRDQMLPAVRKSFKQKFNQEIFDYGDASSRGGTTVFSTFACEPRYVTNYSGIRNRFCVLSEAATYIPFKDRVEATDRFVSEVLGYVADHGAEVVRITKEADRKVVAWAKQAPEVGVRFEIDTRGVEDVILEKAQPQRAKGRPVDLEKRKMPVYDRFKVTRTAKYPAAYLLPAEETATVALLQLQGVIVEQLESDWAGPTHAFQVTEFAQDANAFQGHKLIRLEGKFSDRSKPWPKGSYVIKMNQRLGLLAFHLLEPENIDGATAWGFVKGNLQVGAEYPFHKAFVTISVPTTVVSSADSLP